MDIDLDEKTPTRCRSKKYMFYKARRKRKWQVLGLLLMAYVGFLALALVRKAVYYGESSMPSQLSEPERYKRDLTEENDENKTDSCIPRSVEEFPGNFMSLEDTQDGGFLIHILFVVYIFGAIAIVCDDYFVASLEIICDELQLSEDVAGATFMAAGSSAPELCTSLIGVFIAESDVGVGTIVGSAVFNILFIIGVCAIFAGMVVELTWWPMFRDCLFYLFSVIALVVVIHDNRVHWYEGLILFLMYLVYILVMYFNKTIHAFAERIRADFKSGNLTYDADNNRQGLLEAQKVLDSEKSTGNDEKARNQTDAETTFTNSNTESSQTVAEEDKYESPWVIPDTLVARSFWIAMLPMKVLFYVTVPDCRKPWGHWRKLYPLTFMMSIVWLVGLSYVMVWMVAIAGDALEIPDTVMGLTLLAAGTSVPDCLASLFVARDGYGDMAISNSIGSNVFDVLVCLGIPWLIRSAAIDDGEPIMITSDGLTYSALTLLSTVFFIGIAVILAKWKLGRTFGVVCLIAYVVVIALSCLYELNVFGTFNSPTCPRT
ncbi:sodium/potassium/calcium exchanger 3-like isoform X2 [Mizuhopecten yessoensis]|uniref:Sodium/potassium/calcium exchanger 5 n=1 Tax=Mizuhopecten yessoensis TaxID=6573 RepID=A0A210QG44_MIZYE|nr:sodium/potassium/calcium exchanger 3-like isoform X2 [Mizuhopecten yessoensis]OWF47714.1 Sodium/potassium/calcium exchanger 5 [Mizuhopecten yessoensis]